MLHAYIHSTKLLFIIKLGVRFAYTASKKYFKWVASCWNGRKLLV